ncbi:ABC transporter substrate-binding protein [Variovorax ginsengisoli]|uniref:Sulfonate transport system substrate-binding protein n=1 Tax=Variovorax ginsengisoli TaxID=363844 RepID=A0ABT9S8Z9_9BURK|nr:ABC transporter substrate-binding protein [Variovorax ginsengisoli]MDP9899852.1 sulfonate transport system substrate-binding protein [Variovorax ginsengisoli]
MSFKPLRPLRRPSPLPRGAASSRRQWLQAAAALAVGASPPFAQAAVSAGAGPDLSGVTLRIGTYKGLWRPLIQVAGQASTPYRIDWRELNNGVLHIEAINGDALDIGSGSEIPATFAARQKASVRFIAASHEDLNNQVTLARKDTPIRSIADLRGKRVGYVRATTAHYYLSKQLAEAGLGFSDIQAVNLTPADGLSAFARGDLDAWAIYGYNGQIARTQYGARILKTGKGYLSGNFPVYANPRAIDDPLRHAAITDFLLRLQRAYAWANPNFLAYAKAQSAETRVPVGDLVELFNGRSDDFSLGPVTDAVVRSHQEVADAFQRLGVLDGPAHVAPLWDRSFSKALAVRSVEAA